jgi:preprotein translocase subunit SecG
MSILTNILLGVYLFVSVLMMLVILMQRPKSEGLGAAFGGGVTENIFGAQTTNVLTKITGWLAAIFFLLTFALSILYARKGNTQSDLRRELMKGQVPASPAASVAPVAPGSSPAASPSPAPTVKPADLAVGAVPPTTSSVAPATSPAVSPQATAAPSVAASPKP